ncbi:MAG: Pr6Pr family membrane protein [Lachnospiraceae bacterium]|nr:Pr6Pr family membrane protein [Lachnospiraceae bacterium]
MNASSKLRRCFSYTLKTIVIIAAAVGVFLSAYAGRNTFMGGSRVFMYFTIQSNIAVALISLIGCCLMLTKKKVGEAWHVIQFVGAVAITLTGIVFGFVLAPTLGVNAWNVQNTLTHVVVPIAAVVDFLIVAYGENIRKKNVIYVIIPPILYAIYAAIGYVRGWDFALGINYPYFFLNWGSPAGAFGFTKEMPYMGTAWWILALLIFLIIVGCCYLMIININRKNRR